MRLRAVGARGRVGLMVTRIGIAPDLGSVSAESTFYYQAQTQHSCHQGQSSQPEKVNLGRRDVTRLSDMSLRISLLGLALTQNPARFPGMACSRPVDSGAFASPFAQNAKCQRLSLPLVTRVLG